ALEGGTALPDLHHVDVEQLGDRRRRDLPANDAIEVLAAAHAAAKGQAYERVVPRDCQPAVRLFTLGRRRRSLGGIRPGQLVDELFLGDRESIGVGEKVLWGQ